MHTELDTTFSENKKHSTGAEASGLCCKQELLPAQRADVDDASVAESDDNGSSWTDVSSDGDKSGFSDQDSDSADSCGCSDRKGLSEKRQSQHSHSPSSLQTCSGEKLVMFAVL